MAKKIWTDARNQQLIAMYESKKYSTREIATGLGVSQRTIYNRLEPLELSPATLPRRHRAPVKFDFSETERDDILRLHAEGKKNTEIARLLRRTIGPVRRVCAELGLRTSNFKPVIIGEKFGFLKVVGLMPPKKTYKGHNESKCIVECHCGNRKEVFNYNLRSGNTATCGCKLHLLNTETPYLRIFHGYFSGAKSRGLEWELNIAQIKYLVHRQCFYCRTDSSNNLRGRNHQGRSNYRAELAYMGIDRVDSAKGYSPGNVLPACKMCNRAKSNASLPDFVAWLKRLGSNLDEKEILREAVDVGRELEEVG
jgi:DNA-binding CsgD family transcriptional regulator